MAFGQNNPYSHIKVFIKKIIRLNLVFCAMRFKDFLITIIISTITSLIIIWTLINAGIIQTQQYPQLYIKQQYYSGTLAGAFNETSKEHVAYIEKIPIENVSDTTIVRLLHISLEANITNYDPNGEVNIEYFRLRDQNLQIDISEKSLSFAPKSYVSFGIDRSVFPVHAYYISLKTAGTYNFMLTYNLTIIQEIFT